MSWRKRQLGRLCSHNLHDIFYEWDAAKEKVTFKRENEAVIYMAGFFNVIQDELKFVILTTTANSSMISVHDRMPLILEQGEVSDWVCNVDAARKYLNKVPSMLKQEREYSMFRAAGLRFAMGNAVQALKDEADIILPSNREDGIAYAVRHYLTEG